MTNVLGFQTIKICDPHGQNDVIVVIIDGNFLVGFSYKFNWIKLQEGLGNFGYIFRATNELTEYKINWNIDDVWNLDSNCIGKLSLCVFSEDFSPIITELLDIEDNNTQKKIKFSIPEQVIYNFETEEYIKVGYLITIVTMNQEDDKFIFEPELKLSNITMGYKAVGNFFEDLNKKTEDYVSLDEIINSKTFGDVRFTILNNKIFTRVKNNNQDICIELDNSTGNINDDNISQLKKVMDSYNQIKIISDEYVKNNYFNDYKIQDFFIELFLKYNKNNLSEISDKLDKFNELSIEEKINFIPFLKLIINYLAEEKYCIKLGFYSGNDRHCSSLWLHFDDNFSFKSFSIEEIGKDSKK